MRDCGSFIEPDRYEIQADPENGSNGHDLPTETRTPRIAILHQIGVAPVRLTPGS